LAVRTYDAAQVILTVNGVEISGYASDTFISIEREEPSFTKVVGADGTTSRAKSNNRSGTMTITLSQTSPSNDYLSALLAQDELSNSGVVPVILKDISGQSRFFSGTGWVQGMPSVEYAKEISDREWLIDLADMEFNIAGNIAVGGAEA
jgi:hypothetical protein